MRGLIHGTRASPILHSSWNETGSGRAFVPRSARYAKATYQGFRIVDHVPVLRAYHIKTQNILLGVWEIAEDSLARHRFYTTFLRNLLSETFGSAAYVDRSGKTQERR